MIKKAAYQLSALLKADSFSGILLMVCLLLSLLIANSGWGPDFNSLLATMVGYQSGALHLRLSVLNWINDGLMAVFFFFVGLEIKQELTDGHLSGFKKAAVPVFAAVGGAIVPAVIFTLINRSTSSAQGWGIPMATDIAFAVGVLSVLGKSVPAALRVFMSTLAVVDDLLAILVIAVFYSGELHWALLLSSLGIFLFLLILNKLGVKNLLFYILPGLVMWYCIHLSGVHATLAGVLTAFAIPAAAPGRSPLKDLAHRLAAPVNFVIMPLFAVANTNIRFEAGMMQGLVSRLSLGIIIGLIVGKPLGVMLSSWLSVQLKIGALPDSMSWKHITGIGLLAGIGFTISIFISFLSFGNSQYDAEAKFAILVASVLAGLTGFIYLKRVLSADARHI